MEERKTPQELIDFIREEGQKKLVDLSSQDKLDLRPPWFDDLKYIKARDAIRKYQVGVEFSSLTGLILILQVPDAIEPLLATGNSKDVPSLFRRYLATVIHVRSWYTDNIFDPSSKGYRSIRQVRGMHKRIQNLMNEKYKTLDLYGNSRVWLNQYDMSVTQFAFAGLALAYPEKCGLVAASEEELELINYYWRILGYMMGLDDRFNSCQFDNYSDIRSYNRLILKQEFVERFDREPCDLGLRMTQAICAALKEYLPLVTFNSLAIWWSDVLKFNGYKIEEASAKERLMLSINRLSFKTLLKNETILKWGTKFHVFIFNARVKRKEKTHKRLERKYKNCEKFKFYSEREEYYEAKCPYNLNKSDGSEIGGQVKGCPLGFISRDKDIEKKQVELC